MSIERGKCDAPFAVICQDSQKPGAYFTRVGMEALPKNSQIVGILHPDGTYWPSSPLVGGRAVSAELLEDTLEDLRVWDAASIEALKSTRNSPDLWFIAQDVVHYVAALAIERATGRHTFQAAVCIAFERATTRDLERYKEVCAALMPRLNEYYSRRLTKSKTNRAFFEALQAGLAHQS